ncbi:hypothetical protein Cgig2_033542 [Carnegiea gigantea]|uniref:Uncharacterized protein n=1 Tax=Carnegiea gigantea TaxID=171969 RepID=A0A9Q1QBH7_9CARY|nr:hypothetical protein Cgig2_033542 [Carnegiea gigantea]
MNSGEGRSKPQRTERTGVLRASAGKKLPATRMSGLQIYRGEKLGYRKPEKQLTQKYTAEEDDLYKTEQYTVSWKPPLAPAYKLNADVFKSPDNTFFWEQKGEEEEKRAQQREEEEEQHTVERCRGDFKGNDEHGYMYVARNVGLMSNCRSLGVKGGERPTSRLRLGGDTIEMSDDDEICVASEDAGDEEATKEDDAVDERAA